jgi:ATP-dependent Clp protease ATP-binding subunit ClpC
MAIENLTYPLLYFQLADDAVLGMLLDGEYQVVESDLRKVKKSLSEHLSRQYKKTADYPFIDLYDATLRLVKVKIAPAFRLKGRAFQLTHRTEVTVPAVTGKRYEGHYECHFPLLEESFIYNDVHQLNTLIQSFAGNILYNKPPQVLFQLAQLPQPELDFIEMRVKTDRAPAWRPFNGGNDRNPALERLTEPYPAKRSLRARHAFPEVAWEMDWAVNQAIDKLAGHRANLLIIGPPGSGKSAVLKQAIRKISSETRRTFWRIMSQRITASSKYLGEWQELVEQLIDELQWVNGVLWVEDILQLASTGGSGAEDSVAAFMQTYLRQMRLQIAGEATPEQFDRLRQKLPGFAELFQTITLPEMEEKTALAVLEKFSAFVGQTQKIEIPLESQHLAFRLLKRYYPYEQFPGKGIKFLAQCATEARVEERTRIGKEAVLAQFTQQTGLPEIFLRDDLRLDQEELRSHFQGRIIGQEEAVESLCNVVKIFKAGLNNPHKPITTLLFAGPTGVGKTASAQALADYFFGKGQRKKPLVRIDMSEFQAPGDLSRLIGSGNEIGFVVREIRERPFAVLLLDEVEKAHPSVYDSLLSLLDEGVMTDAFGRVANFRNTIIILTTNLGASSSEAIGFGGKVSFEQRYRAAVERSFRPEFINRIDQMVFFRPLNAGHIQRIALKELSELEAREGIVKYGIRLQYAPALIERLASAGFDERYGARPLQRALEEEIVYPLSRWLSKRPELRDKTLALDYQNGELLVNELNT